MNTFSPVYKEKQYFRQWWLWLPLAILTATHITIFSYLQFQGEEQQNIWDIIIPLAAELPVLALLIFMRMESSVTEKSLTVRFVPLPLKKREFSWQDVSNCELVKYNPLKDYGGWGIKGTSRKRAYNIIGNFGLLLHLTDGRTVMIGTGTTAELDVFIQWLASEKIVRYENKIV